MDSELTQEQMEKMLKLCDILSLQDATLAAAILEESEWNIEKALTMMEEGEKKAEAPLPPPQTYQNQIDPYSFDENEQPEQYDYHEYEYEFEKQKDIQNKKKMFQNEYVSIPLLKTTSEGPNKLEKKLMYDRLLKEDYSNHRSEYQKNLLENSDKFCQTILASKSEEVRKFYENKRKNQNNRKFLTYLHEKYKTRINFTFGTFLLNLTRSYLDKKTLLVYVHKSQFEENKSVEMLLNQKEIAHFVNKHCISYGMFDSSDDYEIVQKYLPMKNLPAFALFKFDKKRQKEEFISEYVILKKDQTDFIQWLAYNIGIAVKKKEQTQQTMKPEMSQGYSITEIVRSQNLEYEEMEKMFQLRRQQSKIKKQQMETFEEDIEVLKEQFKEQNCDLEQKVQMKFRLPMSGKCLLFPFGKEDKVKRMFEYIHCFGREEFEDKYAEFDLTQTFPKLSLMERKEELVGEVFEDSERENIIVKEL